MRTSLSRVATTVMVGLLVTGCGSATSPTPGATASPSQLPTAAPSDATSRPTSSPAPVTPTMGRIAAGYVHTCVVTDAGAVRCWGTQNFGDGTTTEASPSVNVVGLASGITAIAAGNYHTCVLTGSGGVKCWGSNSGGELGNGTTSASTTPVDVTGLSGGNTAISAGGGHTCALTNSGGVKCWGSNPYGALGDGTNLDSSVPVDVVGLDSGISMIAAGGLHTCALTRGGSVTCWGDGQHDDAEIHHTNVPVDVPGLENDVRLIAAGNFSTCAVRDEGSVTCWGPNYAPPPGERLPDRFVPVDVSRLAAGVSAITVGDAHSCVLTGGGAACWGGNSYGELGNGLTSDSRVPFPVDVAGLGSGVAGIAVGGMHTCALITGDSVKCWGSNTYGQLGTVMRCSSTSIPLDVRLDGSVGPVPTPGPIQLPAGRLEHTTGATDVLFRFDHSPDFAVGDLVGELFQPGPEFTIYGDGTVIFRDESSAGPPSPSRIVRARPFMIAHLEEDQVQAFLRFALDEGGLWDACERYETQDVDVSSWATLTVHAAGIDKRVEYAGYGPFGALYERIGAFGGANPTAVVWVADRYWGNLLDASVFQFIGDGVTPGLAESGTVAWPWPGIAPADFVGRDEGGWIGHPRRVMSAAEAAVHGLSDNGGVVQRVYLEGPGTADALYYFSLWPMQPDETG